MHCDNKPVAIAIVPAGRRWKKHRYYPLCGHHRGTNNRQVSSNATRVMLHRGNGHTCQGHYYRIAREEP